MSCIQYQEIQFRSPTLRIIERSDAIVREYLSQGFRLTLRQLFYQHVARGFLPNTQSEYKRLGSIVNDARLAGHIDWDAIEDRTRNLESWPAWEDPSDRLRSAAETYALDLWEDQEYRPEVWIEKEALAGVVEDACSPLAVPFFSCRGYVSQSEMHAAAKRLQRWARIGYTPIIFHLGDHDPSGIDMSRDIQDRLHLFAPDVEILFERLALNFDQVERYRPPPNPAKETDSRHGSYALRYGRSSWELDALNPTTLATLIENAVLAIRDEPRWNAAVERQEVERKELAAAAGRWDDIRSFLEERPP